MGFDFYVNHFLRPACKQPGPACGKTARGIRAHSLENCLACVAEIDQMVNLSSAKLAM